MPKYHPDRLSRNAPADAEIPRDAAMQADRRELVNAIELYAPAPLVDLRDRLAPVWKSKPPEEREAMLLEWSKRWHLDAQWIRFEVRLLLDSGCQRNRRGFPSIQVAILRTAIPERPEPEPLDWNPTRESERDFRARVKDYIEDYIEKIRSAAEYSQPVPSESTVAHFKWFVLYQVAGLTLQDLVDVNKQGKSTIHEAITKIAARVGIPLRTK